MRVFVDVPYDLPEWRTRAPFLKIANAAFSGSWQVISDATIMYCSRGSQRFAVRTEIDVALGVVGEVGAREHSVSSLVPLPYGNMRYNAFVQEPGKHLTGSIGGIGREPLRLQAPGVIHQAIASAYAGRGVAHLTLPQDVISAKAEGGFSSVATLKPGPEFAAIDEDIAEIARIDKADSVVIMCGGGCRGAADVLCALSDRLKAPLIHSVKGKDIMPYDDPRWMGGIGMIGTKAVYNAVMGCDLLLMLARTIPTLIFCQVKGTIIQVDERPQVLGRRAPTVLGVAGSAHPTLKLLLDKVASKDDTRFWDKVTQERQKWDDMLDKQADPARSKDRIHPQAVARAVSDLAKPDPVFTLDTGLNTLWSGNWIRQSGSQRIIGSFNNAAVGTALGQANGVQALDRSRQVIALCGDGGFNMLMCEFLTAVHPKLPVKVVIFNNSAFGLITLEAESVGLPPFRQGIEFPNPDFAALARAYGGHGFAATKPGELKAAVPEAFAIDGPAIVDAESCGRPHLGSNAT